MLVYLTDCTQVGQSWLHRSVVSQQCTSAISEAGALVIPPLEPVSPSLWWEPPKYSILALETKGAPSAGEYPSHPVLLPNTEASRDKEVFCTWGQCFFPYVSFLYYLWKTDTFHRMGPMIILHDGLAKLGYVLKPSVLTTTTSFLGFFFSTERKIHFVNNQNFLIVTVDTKAKISSKE